MGFIAMMTPVTSNPEESPHVVDLIAGQHLDVGDIHIWNDDECLYVKYVIVDETPEDPTDNWYITETHLHIGYNSLDDIPQTGNKNPIPGQFEYQGVHDYPTLEVLYTHPLPDTWDADQEVYVAAHAVVMQYGGLDGLEKALPDYPVTASVKYPYGGGPSYFPQTTVSGGTFLDGVYQGWCVDTDRVIYQNKEYSTLVYSSYEDIPTEYVDKPYNLDLVNYVINQDYVGKTSPGGYGIYTYGDVQRVIWTLIEDLVGSSSLGSWSQNRVDEILADVYANGEGFEPGPCDKVGLILVPIDNNGNIGQICVAQAIMIEFGIPCETVSETAWGDGPGFPGPNWATYIIYHLPGDLPPEDWPNVPELNIAFEDLPLCGGNDWDYNDFVVTMEIEAKFYGSSTYHEMEYIEFTVTPQAKMAGYWHKMHLAIPAGTFGEDGTYELVRTLTTGPETITGDYDDSLGLDVLVVTDTQNKVPINSVLTITFTEGPNFFFPEWDDCDFHGESLFFDPYLEVMNTGETVHPGDPRFLSIPDDWMWQTPDGRSIWLDYDGVGMPTAPELGPTFAPEWWET
jgi:hypothetical protein